MNLKAENGRNESNQANTLTSKILLETKLNVEFIYSTFVYIQRMNPVTSDLSSSVLVLHKHTTNLKT